MKNLLVLFVLMFLAHFVTAQSDNNSAEKSIGKITTSSLKITMHFKDVADLKRFQTQELSEMKVLKKLEVNPNFTFIYTLGEPNQSANLKSDVYGLKVEIKDHDNKESLLKEADSIDGVIELYESGLISK